MVEACIRPPRFVIDELLGRSDGRGDACYGVVLGSSAVSDVDEDPCHDVRISHVCTGTCGEEDSVSVS